MLQRFFRWLGDRLWSNQVEVEILQILTDRYPEAVYGLSFMELIPGRKYHEIAIALRRLEDAGYIKGEFRERVHSGDWARRKYYSLVDGDSPN